MLNFTKLIKSPLTHFSIAGCLLYGVYFVMNPASDWNTVNEKSIKVSAEHIDYLSSLFAQRMMRAPTQGEMRDLVEQHIRDEIYYREAIRMGLGNNDPLIRRRMRQKLDFILLDTAKLVEPDKGELQQFMQQHAHRYMSSARLTFEQVYIGEEGSINYSLVKEQLERGDINNLSSANLMLQKRYEKVPTETVYRRFGAQFVNELLEQPTGSWQVPVFSGFGVHAVRLESYQTPTLPTLDDKYETVLKDWRAEKTASMEEQIYQDLRSEYKITIDYSQITL